MASNHATIGFSPLEEQAVPPALDPYVLIIARSTMDRRSLEAMLLAAIQQPQRLVVDKYTLFLPLFLR